MGASDSALTSVAAGQFGVFDREDAARCGLSRGQMARRIADGRWLRLHRGVFALGHDQLRLEGRWLAAVRACGRSARLSHGDAMAAWGMRPVSGTRIEVTVAHGVRRNPDPRRIRVHEARGLAPTEGTQLGPIPITTVARTLLDMSSRLGPRSLEGAISEADLRELYDGRQVRAILAAHPNRAGARKLTAVLDGLEGVGVPRTRGDMEIRFRAFCDAAGLPQPLVNQELAGAEVDFWWPAANLIVETDGWAHHRMPARREADAVKRLRLEAMGYRVVVLTWQQITGRPGPTGAALGHMLSPAPAASPR